MSRFVTYRSTKGYAILWVILICGCPLAVLAKDNFSKRLSYEQFDMASVMARTLTFEFDEERLWSMGIELYTTGGFDVAHENGEVAFSFDVISPNDKTNNQTQFSSIAHPMVSASGVIVLEREGIRELILATSLSYENDGSILIQSAMPEENSSATFSLIDADWESDREGGQLLVGNLVLTPSAALRLGFAASPTFIVGRLRLKDYNRDQVMASANFTPAYLSTSDNASGTTASSTFASNPDVIVGDLQELNSYGFDGNISAFSVGTVSCNIGNDPLNWFRNTNQHPVIGQNMYRYKEGRFEQIGMSWLKHGFFALSQELCFTNRCVGDPTGEHLGPKCSDPYSANLNGQQLNLGPRSEVNAFTGEYQFPFGGVNPASIIGRRLQVSHDDLLSSMNPGALYYVEGQYVTPDDAMANNGFNNASYRKIGITELSGGFVINFAGEDTVRMLPAIHAWQSIDPQVQITPILVPQEGVFTLGSRVTNLGNGTWHYEYALHNLNSHQSAKSFSVPLFAGIALTNIGFHDVAYHSGEPYDQTAWQVDVTDDAITWSTEDFNVNPNANALRWGTMYNFRFDANAAAEQLDVSVGMFRSGAANSVSVMAPSPSDQIATLFTVAPPHDISKDRYISVDPSANPIQPIAIRVMRNQSTDMAFVSCTIDDLGVQGSFASLVDTPEFCLWDTSVLHIGGCIIAPGNTYAVSGSLDAVNFSAPLLVSTTAVPIPKDYGDIVGTFINNTWSSPDHLVTSNDILAVIKGFQLDANAPMIARLDAVPRNPNHILASDDILSVVRGFSGNFYEYGSSCITGTCIPTCTNP